MRSLSTGFFALSLLIYSVGAKADFDAGLAAYQTGDYVRALEQWTHAGDAGDSRAQYNLGLMYRRGLGVPVDENKAASWFKKAADHGDAEAQHNLARLYEHGTGVGRDIVEAARLYREAASQGLARAK